MTNGNRKEFLNSGILGSGAGVPQKRGFRPVSTEYIGSPDYDPRFFETFPTVWANAYAFRKALEGESRAVGERTRTAEYALGQATDEWVTLFLLHYFGVIHLQSYGQQVLEEEYDKDLWLALNGTYPNAREDGMSGITLLQTDDHAVVGAYYPEVVFFPSRGRESWKESQNLEAYMRGTSLSWAQASRILLDNESTRHDFHAHLRLIADKVLQSGNLKDHLNNFCRETFGSAAPVSGTLGRHPSSWNIPGNVKPEPKEFLDKYPLSTPNAKGGKTYYLVSGMPHPSPWMTTAISSGWPSPIQYRRSGGREISVKFAGADIACNLEDNDEIMLLRDLFLPDAPFWCKVPRSTEAHASRVKSLHEVELRDSILTPRDVAVCLAPVKREFLERFPETFQNLASIYVVPGQGSTVEWLFPVRGKEVRWVTKPIGSTEMPNTSLMMWPPKVSRRWKLYSMYGTGSKESCGRWHLVDEHGWQGKIVDLEEEEYVSYLHRPGNIPNRPRALMFSDTQDKERGVLFLSDFEEQAVDAEGQASLAVDFGTSNTCLAFNNGQSDILKFKLSPVMLWGKRTELENPGFVPTQWGGAKGFFPTVLLSRRYDERLPDISPEDTNLDHLFKVDVPGLHKGIEQRLYLGHLNQGWRIHPNLKWDADPKTPWRALFLELTMLYAHAELFFSRAAVINRYTFTFPLAFTKTFRDRFHAQAQQTLRRVRQICYGSDPQVDQFEYVATVDESTAIADSIREGSSPTTMEVFVDVGGGTADIAIRHNNRFLVLDSLEVAGKTFFRVAERNFKQNLAGSSQFKKHLGRLLQGNEQELNISTLDRQLDLGTFYSVAINDLSDETFRGREESIIKKGMGVSSYQRYRSRLFFRHILAYALLQTCAAAVSQKVTLINGIKLILGGNAWGLMLFAEFPRSTEKLQEEAREILKLIKRQLADTVYGDERECLDALEISNIELLNEDDLSKAKTSVALGALNAGSDAGSHRKDTTPYAGVTIRELKINDFNPATIRWCDRWGFNEFKETFGFMDQVTDADFEKPQDLRKPLDPVLSVFTFLGNVARNDQDNMPENTWTNINGEISKDISQMRGDRLDVPPLNHFVSSVLYPDNVQRDFLDTLAERNGNYKPNSNED
ncbi:MAG TPA: hypothetical protein VEY11_08225 [Pyrinomonadaceae bacterium]|nr:hypothetical protein [Pyrinomonadaceae bacterium]